MRAEVDIGLQSEMSQGFRHTEIVLRDKYRTSISVLVSDRESTLRRCMLDVNLAVMD